MAVHPVAIWPGPYSDGDNPSVVPPAPSTGLERLCAEYSAWCEAEGLPPISADDQDPHELTARQCAWLHDFIERWNGCEEMA